MTKQTRPSNVQQIEITDRAQWLALRRHDVTASVAGALLGVHDYATPLSLWALKTGAITEDPEETPAMRRGRLFEPVAVEMLKQDYPRLKNIERPGLYFRDPTHRLGATPDVFATDEERGFGVIQIKAVEKGVFRRKWPTLDDGTIQPPLWIAVQAILEAYLTGARWAAVAPLVVSYGIELPLIEIPIHAGILDRLKGEAALFWRRVAGELPKPEPDYGRDGALISELYAETDGTVIDLSGDNELPGVLSERMRLSAEKSAAEKRLDEIKAMLTVKMQQAVEASCQGWRIKLPLVNRKAYEVKATSYRQLRITPPKGFTDETATGSAADSGGPF